MMGHWNLIVKNLVRTSLDNYVLPGTTTGTEILLLYLIQWRRDLSHVTTATVYLVRSQCDRPILGRVISHYRNALKEASE